MREEYIFLYSNTFDSQIDKKIKIGYVYLKQNRIVAYYIEKQQGKGLLSGLYEFPWQENQEIYHLFSSSDWIKVKKSYLVC